MYTIDPKSKHWLVKILLKFSDRCFKPLPIKFFLLGILLSPFFTFILIIFRYLGFKVHYLDSPINIGHYVMTYQKARILKEYRNENILIVEPSSCELPGFDRNQFLNKKLKIYFPVVYNNLFYCFCITFTSILARLSLCSNIQYTSREVNPYSFLGKFPIIFTEDEETLGSTFLQSMNILPTDEIVCVHVRDKNFGILNFPGDNTIIKNDDVYRASLISNYLPTIKKLCDSGKKVFRMGTSGATVLDFHHPNFHDYANIDINKSDHDFLDFYVTSNAKYAILSNSGYNLIPFVQGLNVLLVNIIPYNYPAIKSGWMIAFKNLKKNNQILSSDQIYSNKFSTFEKKYDFEANDIDVIDLDSNEIMLIHDLYLLHLNSQICISKLAKNTYYENFFNLNNLQPTPKIYSYDSDKLKMINILISTD